LIPPEVLTLDGEGLDLLVLSLVPDLYDDAAFRRMLVERLLLERAHAAVGTTAAWGRFFETPDVALSAAAIDETLPAFTAWSRARAAALPDRVMVADGRGSAHPDTGCRHTSRIGAAPDVARAASFNLPRFAPELDAAALAEAEAMVSSPGIRPGVVAAYVVTGRPTHADNPIGNSRCDYVNLQDRRSDAATQNTGVSYETAAYVDGLVIAEFPPAVATGGQPRAVDYSLSIEDIAFHPLPAQQGDRSGFRGVLVLRGSVDEMATWIWDRTERRDVVAERFEAEDWQSMLPGRDDGPRDILGLTLGVPLAEVEALAAERLDPLFRFETPPAAEQGVYDHAVGFSGPDAREVFLSIFDPGQEDRPAVALMRYRWFEPGRATVEAVRRALVDKYGEAGTQSGNYWIWGAPDRAIDVFEACGGTRTFRGSGAPRLQPSDPVPDLAPPGRIDWPYYGWPIPHDALPTAQVDRARDLCGPIVAARIRSDVWETGAVDLTVWLLDATTAEARAAERPSEILNLELDEDL
jgi:hypothetical protein